VSEKGPGLYVVAELMWRDGCIRKFEELARWLDRFLLYAEEGASLALYIPSAALL
jgi:hypothetical protein